MSVLFIIDRRGGHFLPQTAEWGEASPRAYFLTMGFRRSQEGSFLDKLLSRRAPELTGTVLWEKTVLIAQHCCFEIDRQET